MSTQTIKLFSHINVISIDKDNNKVTSVEQDMEDIAAVEKNLREAVFTVKKYKEIGYYPLTEPNFLDDVIGHFTNGGLTTQYVLKDNSYHEIIGYPGCTRVWELPLDLRDQVEDLLVGFKVEYDDESWEILEVTTLKN